MKKKSGLGVGKEKGKKGPFTYQDLGEDDGSDEITN